MARHSASFFSFCLAFCIRAASIPCWVQHFYVYAFWASPGYLLVMLLAHIIIRPAFGVCHHPHPGVQKG
jgi:hypothetical protein